MPVKRRKNKTTRPATPTEAEPRIDHLVVMRESAMYDRVLMDGMIRQTLAKVSHLPGANELAEIGVEIFDDPDRYGGIARRSGDSRMVSVERDGVLFHYSMGSAAKADLPDANAFVEELIDLVRTYRPRDVWAVAFTRLLRSADLAGDLMRVFTEHIDALHCEAEINLSTPEGKMLFQMLTMIAAAERDYIVRRHTAGRVAQARRKEWISSAHPPGYQVVDKQLVLVEDAVEPVREMLAVLADGARTAAECARDLGALGISTPKVSQIHGEGATVADARNPSEIISTIVGWADAYETGVYEMLWPNPFPGVTDIAGLAVEEEAGYAHGVLRLTQQLPLPDGGWADAATFNAIRGRLSSPRVTGGASHKTAPPLSGLFRFATDEHEHALACERRTYRLLRRAVDPNRRFHGWTNENDLDAARTDVEHMATVSRGEWHRSIADAVTEAVRTGLPGELDSSRFQSVDGLPPLDERRARVRRLRRELGDTLAALKRAKRNVSLTEDDELAAEYMAQVEQHSRDKRRLEEELESIEGDTEAPRLGESFESNGELVARAMAALANATDSADSALATALRTVISNERWWVEGKTVHWELFIELPHEDGTVVFGPVSGEVRDMALRRLGPAIGRNWRRRIRPELEAAGLGERAARSAAACTNPELTSVLLSHLRGEPMPSSVDPTWAGHVVAVYTDPTFHWNRDQWRLNDDLRREVLDALDAAGGELSDAALQACGFAHDQLRYLGRRVNAPSGDRVISSTGRAANRRHALLECPHCGGRANHSVVTPETRPGVLCGSCWRTPEPDSPVFPEWYRTTLGAP